MPAPVLTFFVFSLFDFFCCLSVCTDSYHVGSGRLFFVVNKMDTLRVSEGLDEEATREYVAQLVTAQLADEGFQLRPEQVRRS